MSKGNRQYCIATAVQTSDEIALTSMSGLFYNRLYDATSEMTDIAVELALPRAVLGPVRRAVAATIGSLGPDRRLHT